MKATATHHHYFQSPYTALLRWIKAVEAIFMSRKGRALAKNKAAQQQKVDWSKSAAFTQDRSNMTFLTAEDIAYVLGRDKENFE